MKFYRLSILMYIVGFFFISRLCWSSSTLNSFDFIDKKNFWIEKLLSLNDNGIKLDKETEKELYYANSFEKLKSIVKKYIKYIDAGILGDHKMDMGWKIYDKISYNKSVKLKYSKNFFESFIPKIPAYQVLKNKLKILHVWEQQWSEKIPKGLVLSEGDKNSSLININQWIFDLGLSNGMLPNEFSNYHRAIFSDIQDSVNAPIDGQFTSDVVDFLVQMTQERVASLKINMERIRWLPQAMEYPHIFVDIADYNVSLAISPNQKKDYKAIVGSVLNPTPIFKDYINGFVVNPTWTVPKRLAREVLLKTEKSTPGYLKRNNFIAFSNWSKNAQKLDVSSVDWETIKMNEFNFKLVQLPGVSNSLGLFKMNSYNPFSVYLHDTNKPILYNYQERAFSAGCVRIQNISEFSRDILALVGNNNIDLDHLVTSGITQKVNLNKSLPVYYVYFTAWPDQNGNVEYRQDLYNLDTPLSDFF